MTDTAAAEDFGFRQWTMLRWSPLAVGALQQMWADGCSFEEMASRLGVSKGSIANKARALGLPQRSSSPEWSDAEVAELRDLWAQGLSAGQIGLVMGRTRNMIIGKAARLKLESRAERLTEAQRIARKAAGRSRRREYKTEKQREYRARMPKPEKLPPQLDPWLGSRNIAFADLTSSECHFPFGDGPFLFCGQPVMVGSSYCAHCYRVAHKSASQAGKAVE